MSTHQYDVIVCGKGPAGIQAALYIKRANLNVLVIGKDGGALERVDKIGNYYGYSLIDGKTLLNASYQQAKDLDIDIQSEEITSLVQIETGFEVITNLNTYSTKAIILATGATRNSIKIPAIKELEGRGVSYCSICDAFFYQKKTVGVLGHGAFAAQEARELLDIASKIYVFTNGLQPSSDFDSKVEFITEPLVSINGTDRIKSVTTTNQTIELSGLFIALGSATSIDLATKLGLEIENNKIEVTKRQQTNMPGIFAAGDCTPGIMQVAKAVGEGCIAALEAINYVRTWK